MSIIVVCPGCRKRFKVSEQFAGKSGPCPSCKQTIQVPNASQEVKVHAPEEFAKGGKSIRGKLLLKPEAFQPTKVDPVTVALIVASAAVVLAVAWVGRLTGLFSGSPIATTIGLLVISPPLVVAAYAILRDPDWEPYRGKPLYIRSAVCALAYAALWGAFVLLQSRGIITGELWNWLFVAPLLAIAGGLFALATLDLDYGDAVLHYMFYIIVTVVLRGIVGLGWIWNLTG